MHSFAGDDPIARKDYVRDKCGLSPWEPRKQDFEFRHLGQKPVGRLSYFNADGSLACILCSNRAPVSPGARYLAGVIALNLDANGGMMRDEHECFFTAIRACARRHPSYFDLSANEYLWLLLHECLDAGVLEADTIGGLGAFLPRLPDWVRQ